MIRIVNYFRQVLCKHEWHTEDITAEHHEFGFLLRKGPKVYVRCKKCGHHSSHWKF